VWNVSIKGNRPAFMKHIESASGHLTEFQAWREDIGWQNRSASLIDLDEMIGEAEPQALHHSCPPTTPLHPSLSASLLIGAIVEGIEALGVLNDTVIFFTRYTAIFCYTFIWVH
jgi:hypothetical protein